MKKVYIIFSFIVVAACSSNRVPLTSKYFDVSNATKTPWMAGVLGGGTGIDYNIFLVLKGNEKPKFDSMWVSGQRIEVVLNPMKGNLVEIRATLMDPREDYTPEKTDTPVKHPGEALLRYFVGGKPFWISVKNFSKLNPVALP